uniref:Transposase, partial n=1 Tax=Streptococcus salivarius TaxID=1304 RepID=A0A1R3TBN0_STRSL|nr:transposase [Streptococcus salivarius]
MTELERLQAENEYLRAENVVLKKLRVLQRAKRKMEIVRDLVTEFPFDILLKVI